MRVVQTCQGPFRVWANDQVGHVIGDGSAFWDWPIRPAIDAAAAREPTGWAIDLGAAFGWFTIYLAERFAYTVAIEAHPQTFRELLLPNIRAHGLAQKVSPIQYVASDYPGYYTLASAAMHGWPLTAHLDDQPNASSLAFVRQPPAGTVIAEDEPPGLTLEGGPVDALLPKTAPIALIKIDVQGLDLRALVGLTQTIDRCRPTVCFEFEGGPSGWHGDTLQDYLAWFAARAYVCVEHPGSNYVAEPEERA